MSHFIIVPLVSSQVHIEFETKYPVSQPSTPTSYGWLAKDAVGPVKVTFYKINAADPLQTTLEKLHADPVKLKEALQENKLLLAQVHASMAQVDTFFAVRQVELEKLQDQNLKGTADYIGIRQGQSRLEGCKSGLLQRSYIHEALGILESKANKSEDSVSFVLQN